MKRLTDIYKYKLKDSADSQLIFPIQLENVIGNYGGDYDKNIIDKSYFYQLFPDIYYSYSILVSSDNPYDDNTVRVNHVKLANK